MRAPDPADVQALMDAVDGITRREGMYSFLGSVKDLVNAGEPDTAVDYLANGLLGWAPRISPDEFAVLKGLCQAWDLGDRIDDFAALVMLDPTTDPQQ